MAHPGILHRYKTRLVAFEHTPADHVKSSPNLLLWVGGLGDGLLTPSYPSKLAKRLPSSWHLVEVLLTSSYKGWGTGSLARDARELGECVTYFRNSMEESAGKIVLMGHSTGCQDLMEYLVGEGSSERPSVQGAILQAGISDREGVMDALSPDELESSKNLAKQWVNGGRGKDILPHEITRNVFGSSPSAARWLSLVEKGGTDDYFSSDLTDEQLRATFGRIGTQTPVIFLLSGSDEHMPQSVDKEHLNARWISIVQSSGGFVDAENGGIVPGAHHNYEGDGRIIIEDFFSRVLNFIDRITKRKIGSNTHL